MIAASFVLAAGLAPQIRAQEMTLNLDPASTRIEFTLPATLHTVHGTFKLKSGAIHFNISTGAASGEVLVDVTSGDTGNQRRDRKMHGEILETQAFPEAKFIPEKISGKLGLAGASDVELSGTLTLHGSDHPVTLPTHVEVDGNSVTGKTQLVVPYVAWGIKDPSTTFIHVSDKVTVDITATGRLLQLPRQATTGGEEKIGRATALLDRDPSE